MSVLLLHRAFYLNLPRKANKCTNTCMFVCSFPFATCCLQIRYIFITLNVFLFSSSFPVLPLSSFLIFLYFIFCTFIAFFRCVDIHESCLHISICFFLISSQYSSSILCVFTFILPALFNFHVFL
jgi:hypothetical protein